MIAALFSLAILFYAPATSRLERGASAEEFRSVSSATSLAQLHSAPANRIAFDLRSPTRSSAGGDLPLAGRALDLSPLGIQRRVAIAASTDNGGDALIARGYDATAPPAVS